MPPSSYDRGEHERIFRATGPFDVLGVQPGETEEAIRRRYHRLAVKLHPDKHRESDRADATAALARINQAHEDVKRLGYNASARGSAQTENGAAGRSGPPSAVDPLREILDRIERIPSVHAGGRAARVDSPLRSWLELEVLGRGVPGASETILGGFGETSVRGLEGTSSATVLLTGWRILFGWTTTTKTTSGNVETTTVTQHARSAAWIGVERVTVIRRSGRGRSVDVRIERSREPELVLSGVAVDVDRLIQIAAAWGIALATADRPSVALDAAGAPGAFAGIAFGVALLVPLGIGVLAFCFGFIAGCAHRVHAEPGLDLGGRVVSGILAWELRIGIPVWIGLVCLAIACWSVPSALLAGARDKARRTALD